MTSEIPTARENSGDDFANEKVKSVELATISSQELESVRIYPYHRDPGYRPWLRPPGPRKPTPYEEIIAMMARNVDRAVVVSKAVLVFSIVIMADLLLPKTTREVEVTGYNLSAGGTYQMELKDGSVVNISKKAMRKMKGKHLRLASTILFQVPFKMTDKENNSASFEISIYGNFLFMPLVLLLTSLVGVLHKKVVELRFNLGVASAVLAILNIAFLHVHKF